MGRLDGKVAFITGAGSGIARSAAQLFTQEGAKVVIAELKPELGQATEDLVRDAGGDATCIETDVTQEDSVKIAIQKNGRAVWQTRYLVQLRGWIDCRRYDGDRGRYVRLAAYSSA